MKRLVPFMLVGAVCYFAGYATSSSGVVAAQAGGGRGQAATPEPKAPKSVDGKATVFTKEQIEKMFPPADKAGNLAPLTASTHLGWDPFYRFTEMRRVYYDPARKDPVTGEMINYPGAEMHENKTQIYAIHQGVGAVVLGGKPGKDHVGADGQHSGGSLQGGTTQRVKAGDFLVIPPRTWHQVQPDPGQTLAYGMCHIETRRMMP